VRAFCDSSRGEGIRHNLAFQQRPRNAASAVSGRFCQNGIEVEAGTRRANQISECQATWGVSSVAIRSRPQLRTSSRS
jgi:hypothetical protein